MIETIVTLWVSLIVLGAVLTLAGIVIIPVLVIFADIVVDVFNWIEETEAKIRRLWKLWKTR